MIPNISCKDSLYLFMWTSSCNFVLSSRDVLGTHLSKVERGVLPRDTPTFKSAKYVKLYQMSVLIMKHNQFILCIVLFITWLFYLYEPDPRD